MDDETTTVENTRHADTPQLDVEKYREFVDEFDLTEERKVELLQTLWSMMSFFVQHGFGVDSLHRFIPALKEISSERDSDGVEDNSREDFNSAVTERKED